MHAGSYLVGLKRIRAHSQTLRRLGKVEDVAHVVTAAESSVPSGDMRAYQ